MYTIRSWLLIGRYAETLDLPLLNGQQIGAMLQLADPVPQPGVVHRYLNIDDGVPLKPAMLRQGVDFIHTQQAGGQRVLVACGAGISRSTAFAIAALKETEQLTLREAAGITRRAHPNGMPHYALWESLCEYYGEQIDYLELLRI